MRTRNLFVVTPKRPDPIEYAAEEIIPWHELGRHRKWGVLGNEHKLEYIKRCMVHKIAEALVEKLEPFIVQRDCEEGEAYRVQVTLSDRGAYENWLPMERKAGRREGFMQGEKAIKARLPHGIDLDRIEE